MGYTLNLFRRSFKSILFLTGRCEFTGQENLPRSGPFILVTNHMSSSDVPLIFLSMPTEIADRIRFFAGEKWERHPLFGPMMKAGGAIYINRGEVDRQALKEALTALAGGAVFALAPEGTRSRVRKMIEARTGAAYLASRAKVPIVPVGLSETDNYFPNLRRLRRTDMQLRIGQPFYLPDLDGRARGEDLEAYTHLIMAKIALLIPERYHGYYADSPALAALQRGEEAWPHHCYGYHPNGVVKE